MRARRSRKHQEGKQHGTLPAVNSAVELVSERWPEPARSRVDGVTGQRLTVSRPSHAGSEPITGRLGDQVILHWTTRDALYEVATEICDATEGKLPTWTLALQGPVRRQQRREAFRLDVALAGQLGTPRQPAGLAKIHDLSEGGLRCTPPSESELSKGDEVWIELPLPDGQVRLDAEVVRVALSGELGLRFQRTTEAEAEQIRSYLFSEQLARRARLAD